MLCRQTFEVWQLLKQTVTPKVTCLYVFDQRIRSYFIFLNFLAYFLLRNSTLAFRNYSKHLKILAKNILLSENKSSWQQLLLQTGMFGGKTCHVCTQAEQVYSSHVHTQIQPMVILCGYVIIIHHTSCPSSLRR